jgi:hypothetical protein
VSFVIVWLHTGQFIVLYGDVNLVHGFSFSCSVHCWCSLVSIPSYSIMLLQFLHVSLYNSFLNWFVFCLIIFMLVSLCYSLLVLWFIGVMVYWCYGLLVLVVVVVW